MKTKISLALISILFLMACGAPEQKIILKAYNNMYVAAVGDTALIANQPDAAKAQVFIKVDLGEEKWALKTAEGKFVTDDAAKNNFLVINKTEVGDAGRLEIVEVDDTKINIITFNGKAVCADEGLGHRLVANRDVPSTWETFAVEQVK